MLYKEEYKFPTHFTPLEVEGSIFGIGLVTCLTSLAENPLIQVIVSNFSNLTHYIFTCKDRDDLKELLKYNDIDADDESIADQLVKKIEVMENKLNKDEKFQDHLAIEIILSTTIDEISLRNRKTNLKLVFPLRQINFEEKIIISDKLIKLLIEFSSLQSLLLFRSNAQISNKDKIIEKFTRKLIDDHLFSNKRTGSADEMSRDEIFANEAVDTFFASKKGQGNLRDSLEVGTDEIKVKSARDFVKLSNTNYSGKIKSILNTEFTDQWNLIGNHGLFVLPSNNSPKKSSFIVKTEETSFLQPSPEPEPILESQSKLLQSNRTRVPEASGTQKPKRRKILGGGRKRTQ